MCSLPIYSESTILVFLLSIQVGLKHLEKGIPMNLGRNVMATKFWYAQNLTQLRFRQIQKSFPELIWFGLHPNGLIFAPLPFPSLTYQGEMLIMGLPLSNKTFEKIKRCFTRNRKYKVVLGTFTFLNKNNVCRIFHWIKICLGIEELKEKFCKCNFLIFYNDIL